MSEEWIGFSVDLKVSDTEISEVYSYQGIVVDLTHETLTLSHIFKGGLPYHKKYLTLWVKDIVFMEAIEKVETNLLQLWGNDNAITHDTVPTELAPSGTFGKKDEDDNSLLTEMKSTQNSSQIIAESNSEEITNSVIAFIFFTEMKNTNYDKPSTPKCRSFSKNLRTNNKGKGNSKKEECCGGNKDKIKENEFDIQKNHAPSGKKLVNEKIDGLIKGTHVEARFKYQSEMKVTQNSINYDRPSTSKCRSFSKKSRTNNRRKENSKNEECFGGKIDEIKENEFDFQKNLALFDKKLEFEEIEGRIKGSKSLVEVKLDDKSLDINQKINNISLHDAEGQCKYKSDNGITLVSVGQEKIYELLKTAANYGITTNIQVALTSRATADIALNLLAVPYRSYCDPKHRSAKVVVICGMCDVGITGLCTARHLASHGIRTTVYFKKDPINEKLFSQELLLYRMTYQNIVNAAEALPERDIDMIIIAITNEEIDENCIKWVRNCRASVIAINPPLSGYSFNINVSVLSAWPLPHPDKNGKVYLCNLGIPANIYYEAGIDFKYPFENKAIIRLHKNSD